MPSPWRGAAQGVQDSGAGLGLVQTLHLFTLGFPLSPLPAATRLNLCRPCSGLRLGAETRICAAAGMDGHVAVMGAVDCRWEHGMRLASKHVFGVK